MNWEKSAAIGGDEGEAGVHDEQAAAFLLNEIDPGITGIFFNVGIAVFFRLCYC